MLPVPLPEIGETLRVSFRLTGEPAPIVAQCRVVWQNQPFVRGAGAKAPTLPPGCGLQFVAIDAAALERIDAHVRATYPQASAAPPKGPS